MRWEGRGGEWCGRQGEGKGVGGKEREGRGGKGREGRGGEKEGEYRRLISIQKEMKDDHLTHDNPKGKYIHLLIIVLPLKERQVRKGQRSRAHCNSPRSISGAIQ